MGQPLWITHRTQLNAFFFFCIEKHCTRESRLFQTGPFRYVLGGHHAFFMQSGSCKGCCTHCGHAAGGGGGEMVDELDSKYVFKETTERELAALCIALCVHRALNLVCCF